MPELQVREADGSPVGRVSRTKSRASASEITRRFPRRSRPRATAAATLRPQMVGLEPAGGLAARRSSDLVERALSSLRAAAVLRVAEASSAPCAAARATRQRRRRADTGGVERRRQILRRRRAADNVRRLPRRAPRRDEQAVAVAASRPRRCAGSTGRPSAQAAAMRTPPARVDQPPGPALLLAFALHRRELAAGSRQRAATCRARRRSAGVRLPGAAREPDQHQQDHQHADGESARRRRSRTRRRGSASALDVLELARRRIADVGAHRPAPATAPAPTRRQHVEQVAALQGVLAATRLFTR